MRKLLPKRVFIKRFFQVAVPAMVQQLITFVVSLVDTMMVSGLSNNAVSAVYAVNQISFLYFVIAGGLVAGAGIYIQQFYGSKDFPRLEEAHRYKLIIGIIGLAIIIPLCFIFGRYLIGFYARNDDARDLVMLDALKYAPIIYLSYIPYAFTVAYATSFREIGKTHYPMIASAVALVVNIVGNYIFMYVLSLGVYGAAIATFAARSLELVATLLLAQKEKIFSFKTVWTSFHISRPILTRVSKKTAPLLLNEVLWAVGMIILSLAYAQRSNVLSALSVISTMSNLFSIVFLGLSVGISVMVGNTLGQGDVEEAKSNAYKLIFLGVVIGLIIGALFIVFSGVIPLLFDEVTPEQKALASQLFIVYGCFIPIFAIAVCCFVILRTGGKTRLILLLDSFSMWIITVPMTWLIVLFTPLPLVWIYVLVQSVDLLKSAVGLILLKKSNWAVNLTTDFKNDVEMVA
jgi:putative MATE family efflux protein